jgi:hypothetical protein
MNNNKNNLPKEVAQAVEKHQLWLDGEYGGERAYFFGMNLAGLDFSGLDLEGADFSGSNLEGANFEGANLRLVRMENVKAEGANFKGAKLSFSTPIRFFQFPDGPR